jgi:beta-phosphoglucomutase-like phosphatase (HAD superfamily)
LPEDRFYSLGGVPSRDILKLLSAEQGIALNPLAVAREKEAEYLPLIAQVEPINTVVGVAREHYGKIPLAVASGGTKKIIEQVLEHLGIRSLFQAIVTSEDVVNQKPAPDIFLEAARRIGVPPQFCRAYEDTDLGMQAIRAAGMEAVDVRALLVKRDA